MNSFAGEFKTMGQQIVNQFPEGPLCIGLHNPTTRIIVLDMFRFADEGSLNERAVDSLCQLFKTLAHRLPTKNPKMKWAHFAHSEGGLIGNAALTLCSESWLTDTRRFLKNNVMTFTYGAVKPIPNEPVLNAINTYSTKDIALNLATCYLDKDPSAIMEEEYTCTKNVGGKSYTVTLVKSQLAFDPLLKMGFPRLPY